MASPAGDKDLGAPRRVAWLALILACGPTIKPPAPPAEPVSVMKEKKSGPTAPMGRQFVVGEMCPQGAGGRPAVAPLIMRAAEWTDTAADVVAAVERGSVPRFVVFGTDGKMAGAFDTLGIVEVGIAQPVASGTYTGASPCTYALPGKPSPDHLDTRAEEPACGPITGGCGLAVGELLHPDEAATTPGFATGGACVSGDQLVIDIDGDGKPEAFPIGGVLDGIRGPAAEWSASPVTGTACKPAFQVYDLKLVPEPDRGKPVDQKAMVNVDVLGVVDLDGDGRREVVLALRFPTVRSIVVYAADETAQRLQLAGEATSFFQR